MLLQLLLDFRSEVIPHQSLKYILNIPQYSDPCQRTPMSSLMRKDESPFLPRLLLFPSLLSQLSQHHHMPSASVHILDRIASCDTPWA